MLRSGPGYLAVSSESEGSSDNDHAGRSSDEASDSELSSTSSVGSTRTHWRLWPQKRFVFKAILFRELLYLMSKAGFAQKKTGLVHTSVFRRYAERLVSCLDAELPVDYDAFGGDGQKVWLSWADIRRGIVRNAVPPVLLNTWERVALVLEDPDSCILAGVYSVTSMIFIVASIGVVVAKSVMHPEPRSVAFFDNSTIIFFSCDYIARLICSPFCRIAVFDRDWHLQTALQDRLTGHKFAPCCGYEATQMTKLHRLIVFVINPLNLVDLVSVAPYWLMYFFGFKHVPLAFLRAIRLVRFFRRVLKLGKFSVTLNILGRALANSVNMVYVILIYVLLITVLAGSVLQQVETNAGSTASTFQSVPQASWWVTSRMVNGGHRSLMSVNEKVVGKVDTLVGSIVMTVLFVLKGVIWILPFAQIGATFKQYWNENEEHMQLQRDVEIEDTRSAENSWIDSPFVALAPLEVWESGSEHPSLAGTGLIPVPIMEDSAKSTVVTATLKGRMHNWCWFGTATVDVHVTWDPSEVRNGGTHGLLGIQPLQGNGFSGTHGVRWQCVVGAPLGVYGAAEDQWESGRSTGGSEKPKWRGPGATFDICLQAKATQDSKASQVVGVLEMQGHRLSRLAKRTAGLEERSATIMEQTNGTRKFHH